MTLRLILLLVAVVLLENSNAASVNNPAQSEKSSVDRQVADEPKDDLKTAASSGYAGDRYSDWGRYPSGQGVTGYGTVDNYNRYNSYGGYGGYGGGYDSPGYNGYDGDSTRYGGYYGNSGYGGYRGGYGGYGGYSGNGGLNSYYGYNNPYYQGANHLGYGYYKKPGYGNIYNSGITPSLVTGYRGYSK